MVSPPKPLYDNHLKKFLQQFFINNKKKCFRFIDIYRQTNIINVVKVYKGVLKI